MKNYAIWAMATTLALGAMGSLSGCSGSADEVSPAEATKMKASLEQKGPLDLSKVPEKDRAMVEGFMNASKKGQPANK